MAEGEGLPTDGKRHGICPWWLGYFLMCPLLRAGQKPAEILAPHIRRGMKVLEPGSGMGFFTVELARLVGSSGRVVAVDIQPKMLERLKRRAAKAGVLDRVDTRVASPDSMGISDLRNSVDFTLAFAVVHEFPSAARFFAEVDEASKPGALLLFAEPKGHVKPPEFESELEAASQAGFNVVDHPSIRACHSVLLRA
jgi:ubiquinone/menaquinone biosynthesis C-methylase UbiE